MSPETHFSSVEHYANHTEQTEELDLQSIMHDISIYLYFVPGSNTNSIIKMLSENHEAPPFDMAQCVDDVRTNISQVVHDETAIARGSFIANVVNYFPEQDTGNLPTPKRYCKDNVLDGSYRPQLRDTQAECFAESRQALAHAAQEDPLVPDYAVDETAIIEAIRSIRSEAAQNILETQEEIQGTIPLGLSTVSAIVEFSARKNALKSLQNNSGGIGGTTSPERERALKALSFRLKQDLATYLAPESKIGAIVAQHFEPGTRQHAREFLSEYYQSLKAAEESLLEEKLLYAYKNSVTSGNAYVPQENSDVTADKNTEARPLTVAEEVKEVHVNEEELISLGTILEVFPWMNGTDVELYAMKHGGKSLVFCSALPKSNEIISQKVRTKDPLAAKSFDSLWQQAVKTELANLSSSHPHIKYVKNTDFNDGMLLLNYRQGHSPNANRIYYAKTTCAQYPEIAEKVQAQNIDDNTQLLLLIGETDKANQIRLLCNLGISRSQLRAGNAGPA